MRQKVTDGWPKVLPNDDGIRPAGKPDECFYCHRKVGQEHGSECVTVCKLVAYKVMIGDKHVGTFVREEPYGWTGDDCEQHKNESSWCKSNALNHIDWNVDDILDLYETYRQENDAACACGFMRFEFDKVTDEGPFIELRS